MPSMSLRSALLSPLLALAAATIASAQSPQLTLPQPSQGAAVRQTIGVTEITIEYHRPRVRERAVWGAIVPYGEVWRAGANENTTIEFSTPVTVEGHAVAAGRYGLHAVPTAGAWTLILSSVDSAWGSFGYDAKEDLLRFDVQPQPAPHEEALAFTFDDATDRETTAALRWEKLRVPFKIAADTPELVYQSLKRELRGLPQFFWQSWNQAANALITQKVHLDEAMVWVDRSIGVQSNFTNQMTKSRLLDLAGDKAAAKKVVDAALPGATEAELNAYGYQLLGANDSAGAIAIFRDNVKRHPESWNTYDSLGEGLAGAGNKAEAIRQYEKALSMAPEAQKARIQGILEGLKKPG